MIKMERDINRQHSESLVRKITAERERFVSAWQQGARTPELNEIRENIKQLNDLLWETTLEHDGSHRSGSGSQRDYRSRVAPLNNRP
jgi:hypothetical protein